MVTELYVKDISRKLYILWEKELIDAEKGREQFFLSQNVQFEAFILLKTSFSLC